MSTGQRAAPPANPSGLPPQPWQQQSATWPQQSWWQHQHYQQNLQYHQQYQQYWSSYYHQHQQVQHTAPYPTGGGRSGQLPGQFPAQHYPCQTPYSSQPWPPQAPPQSPPPQAPSQHQLHTQYPSPYPHQYTPHSQPQGHPGAPLMGQQAAWPAPAGCYQGSNLQRMDSQVARPPGPGPPPGGPLPTVFSPGGPPPGGPPRGGPPPGGPPPGGPPPGGPPPPGPAPGSGAPPPQCPASGGHSWYSPPTGAPTGGPTGGLSGAPTGRPPGFPPHGLPPAAPTPSGGPTPSEGFTAGGTMSPSWGPQQPALPPSSAWKLPRGAAPMPAAGPTTPVASTPPLWGPQQAPATAAAAVPVGAASPGASNPRPPATGPQEQPSTPPPPPPPPGLPPALPPAASQAEPGRTPLAQPALSPPPAHCPGSLTPPVTPLATGGVQGAALTGGATDPPVPALRETAVEKVVVLPPQRPQQPSPPSRLVVLEEPPLVLLSVCASPAHFQVAAAAAPALQLSAANAQRFSPPHCPGQSHQDEPGPFAGSDDGMELDAEEEEAAACGPSSELPLGCQPPPRLPPPDEPPPSTLPPPDGPPPPPSHSVSTDAAAEKDSTNPFPTLRKDETPAYVPQPLSQPSGSQPRPPPADDPLSPAYDREAPMESPHDHPASDPPRQSRPVDPRFAQDLRRLLLTVTRTGLPLRELPREWVKFFGVGFPADLLGFDTLYDLVSAVPYAASVAGTPPSVPSVPDGFRAVEEAAQQEQEQVLVRGALTEAAAEDLTLTVIFELEQGVRRSPLEARCTAKDWWERNNGGSVGGAGVRPAMPYSSLSSFPLYHVSYEAVLAGLDYYLAGRSFEYFGLETPGVLRDLRRLDRQVTAAIEGYCAARCAVTLWDLDRHLCELHGVKSFRELRLGPLTVHPAVRRVFFETVAVPSAAGANSKPHPGIAAAMGAHPLLGFGLGFTSPVEPGFLTPPDYQPPHITSYDIAVAVRRVAARHGLAAMRAATAAPGRILSGRGQGMLWPVLNEVATAAAAAAAAAKPGYGGCTAGHAFHPDQDGWAACAGNGDEAVFGPTTAAAAAAAAAGAFAAEPWPYCQPYGRRTDVLSALLGVRVYDLGLYVEAAVAAMREEQWCVLRGVLGPPLGSCCGAAAAVGATAEVAAAGTAASAGTGKAKAGGGFAKGAAGGASGASGAAVKGPAAAPSAGTGAVAAAAAEATELGIAADANACAPGAPEGPLEDVAAASAVESGQGDMVSVDGDGGCGGGSGEQGALPALAGGEAAGMAAADCAAVGAATIAADTAAVSAVAPAAVVVPAEAGAASGGVVVVPDTSEVAAPSEAAAAAAVPGGSMRVPGSDSAQARKRPASAATSPAPAAKAPKLGAAATAAAVAATGKPLPLLTATAAPAATASPTPPPTRAPATVVAPLSKTQRRKQKQRENTLLRKTRAAAAATEGGGVPPLLPLVHSPVFPPLPPPEPSSPCQPPFPPSEPPTLPPLPPGHSTPPARSALPEPSIFPPLPSEPCAGLPPLPPGPSLADSPAQPHGLPSSTTVAFPPLPLEPFPGSLPPLPSDDATPTSQQPQSAPPPDPSAPSPAAIPALQPIEATLSAKAAAKPTSIGGTTNKAAKGAGATGAAAAPVRPAAKQPGGSKAAKSPAAAAVEAGLKLSGNKAFQAALARLGKLVAQRALPPLGAPAGVYGFAAPRLDSYLPRGGRKQEEMTAVCLDGGPGTADDPEVQYRATVALTLLRQERERDQAREQKREAEQQTPEVAPSAVDADVDLESADALVAAVEQPCPGAAGNAKSAETAAATGPAAAAAAGPASKTSCKPGPWEAPVAWEGRLSTLLAPPSFPTLPDGTEVVSPFADACVRRELSQKHNIPVDFTEEDLQAVFNTRVAQLLLGGPLEEDRPPDSFYCQAMAALVKDFMGPALFGQAAAHLAVVDMHLGRMAGKPTKAANRMLKRTEHFQPGEVQYRLDRSAGRLGTHLLLNMLLRALHAAVRGELTAPAPADAQPDLQADAPSQEGSQQMPPSARTAAALGPTGSNGLAQADEEQEAEARMELAAAAAGGRDTAARVPVVGQGDAAGRANAPEVADGVRDPGAVGRGERRGSRTGSGYGAQEEKQERAEGRSSSPNLGDAALGVLGLEADVRVGSHGDGGDNDEACSSISAGGDSEERDSRGADSRDAGSSGAPGLGGSAGGVRGDGCSISSSGSGPRESHSVYESAHTAWSGDAAEVLALEEEDWADDMEVERQEDSTPGPTFATAVSEWSTQLSGGGSGHHGEEEEDGEEVQQSGGGAPDDMAFTRQPECGSQTASPQQQHRRPHPSVAPGPQLPITPPALATKLWQRIRAHPDSRPAAPCLRAEKGGAEGAAASQLPAPPPAVAFLAAAAPGAALSETPTAGDICIGPGAGDGAGVNEQCVAAAAQGFPTDVDGGLGSLTPPAAKRQKLGGGAARVGVLDGTASLGGNGWIGRGGGSGLEVSQADAAEKAIDDATAALLPAAHEKIRWAPPNPVRRDDGQGQQEQGPPSGAKEHAPAPGLLLGHPYLSGDTTRKRTAAPKFVVLPPRLELEAPMAGVRDVRQPALRDARQETQNRLTGRWGEQLVFRHLMDRLRAQQQRQRQGGPRQMPRQPGRQQQQQQQYELQEPPAEGRRVVWVNQDQDARLPYDICVYENGLEVLYVEVKSSASLSKALFEISPNQIQFAATKGSQYHLYIVRGARGPTPQLVRLVNPAGLLARRACQLFINTGPRGGGDAG